MKDLQEAYKSIRDRSVQICKNLEKEDYVVQPVADVSPPKWHLGHTTWFFEIFILKPYLKGYKEFDSRYGFVFNSYYESFGTRVIRTDRGNLSRPTVEDIFRYRAHVDEAMKELFSGGISEDLKQFIVLGLNHEQQHQELLSTDIKYILGNNPLMPSFSERGPGIEPPAKGWVEIESGVYPVGFEGKGFCFDNELGRHNVYIQKFRVSNTLVSNEEYLAFMNDRGYTSHQYWHTEGWDWVKSNHVISPMYWHLVDGSWKNYQPWGLEDIKGSDPLCHVSFYEASAYAAWKGMRLPTEFEWEVAARQFKWGRRWEWTNSAYLPYPGFVRAEGAVGEYNGKFMVNQMVLRGASDVTPQGHSRISYRNFFHPHQRWQYTGIRLAEHI